MLACLLPVLNALVDLSDAIGRILAPPPFARERMLPIMAKRCNSSSSHVFHGDITASEDVEGAELWALAYHMPSVALCQCLPGMCPWCVLNCRHGEAGQALKIWKRRKTDLSEDCAWGRFMLNHCKMWILELCKADMKGELKEGKPTQEVLTSNMDMVFNTITGGGGSSSSSRVLINKITCPCPCVQRADACDSEPPPTLPAGLAGDDSEGRSNPLPWTLPSPEVHDSGRHPHGVLEAALGNQLLSPDIVWQYWAGRRSRWRNYDAEMSASLTFMAAYGPVEAQFLISGANYRINVQTMIQDNMATGLPPRAIRVKPVDEAD